MECLNFIKLLYSLKQSLKDKIRELTLTRCRSPSCLPDSIPRHAEIHYNKIKSTRGSSSGGKTQPLNEKGTSRSHRMLGASSPYAIIPPTIVTTSETCNTMLLSGRILFRIPARYCTFPRCSILSLLPTFLFIPLLNSELATHNNYLCSVVIRLFCGFCLIER